jgi:hypothetical protein
MASVQQRLKACSKVAQRLLRNQQWYYIYNEKIIGNIAANGGNGNVGTRGADIFSTKILVGAFYEC